VLAAQAIVRLSCDAECVVSLSSWFAVLTKPRLEAQAHLCLSRQDYECLYPQVKRSVRTASGMVIRTESLFPRYIFICVDAAAQSLEPVRSTRGVTGLVRFGGVPAAVPGAVIEQIKSRIDLETGFVRLREPDLAPGSPVRISQGPLEGIEGIFKAPAGLGRVRVLLSLMGSEREVVIPRTALGGKI